jgi:hypothetical protein
MGSGGKNAQHDSHEHKEDHRHMTVAKNEFFDPFHVG